MGSYHVRYSESKVELLQGQTIIQTVPWDTSYRTLYTDDKLLLITDWDINYDGHLDLGILTHITDEGTNRFYDFYTFNFETYRLERIEAFDEFEPNPSNLVNPTIDIEQKILTTNYNKGSSWIRTQYIFDGEKYVRDQEWINKNGVEKDVESESQRGVYTQVQTNDAFLQITPKGYSIQLPLEWGVQESLNELGDITYKQFIVSDSEGLRVLSIRTPFYSTSFGTLVLKEEFQLQSRIGPLSVLILESENGDRAVAMYRWEEELGTQGDVDSFVIYAYFDSYTDFLHERKGIEERIKNIQEK